MTVSLGHMSISADGNTASVGSLLTIALATFFPKDVNRPRGVVHKDSDHVARVTYGCAEPCNPLGDRQLANDPDAIQLTIHYDTESHDELDFYTFHWKKPQDAHLDFLQDTIRMGDEHWYGGANVKDQKFPIERQNYHGMAQFVLNDIHQNTGTSGQERYWLSSKKVALTVPWKIPLWNSVQNGELVLRSKRTESHYLLPIAYLEYTITVPKRSEMSLKHFHQLCFAKYLKSPTGHPDLALIEKPIWSTWASYWCDVNQEQVLEFARDIQKWEMPISQLELDDKWTSEYGDFTVDPVKFPNFGEMLRTLTQQYGVPRVSAWVHPFVNVESKNGQRRELLNALFVKDSTGAVPRVWWWDCNGNAGTDRTSEEAKAPCAYILDLTKPEARHWYMDELRKLKEETGIYTFKFDAGESAWLPPDYTLHSGDNPNEWGRRYAEVAAEFGDAVEVRHGSGSQQLPIFVRTVDRNSFWDKEGGLSSLIPCALQSSLHGYFWNLPDMVAGNGLEHTPDNIRGVPPEPELYVRWLQANTFLMALQFSYPPWHSIYNAEEMVAHTKKTLAMRRRFMRYMKHQVQRAIRTKEPVIRPMWWAADHPAAFACNDQFMLGPDLVSAPVIEKGATSRNVYLPPGEWIDGNSRTRLNAGAHGRVFENYAAPLDTTPFFYRPNIFRRMEEEQAAENGHDMFF